MSYGLLSRSCFYCPNFITVAPLYLEIKRFAKVTWLCGNDITTSWGGVSNGTLWMRFTSCLNLIFLASPQLVMCRFSKWSFCRLSAVQKLIAILLILGKSRLTIVVYFYWIWTGHIYFPEIGQDAGAWETIQTLSIWQKIEEPCTGSGTSHFQWFNQPKSRTGFQWSNLLFFSVTSFSDLFDKTKYAW